MNKISIIIFSITIILLFNCLLSSKASVEITLKELNSPEYLTVNKNLMLITDNDRVKMFSIKDFKIIKSIGRKGEGPGEFKDSPFPQILSDSIMISSVGKVSFFDFSGNLINEQRTKIINSFVKKTDNKFISDSIQIEKDDFYISYGIYSIDFEKEKSYYKGKWSIHKGGKRDIFEIYFYDVYDNKIVYAHRDGFKIEILDENGNNLHTIKKNPNKITLLNKDLDKILLDMEKNTKNKGFVRALRQKGIKPDYFPDIRECRVSDGKIYVITYLKEKEKSECFIFNMKGKQLKRTFIPLKAPCPLIKPVFTFNDGLLYQLVENIDDEQWQLIINKIE